MIAWDEVPDVPPEPGPHPLDPHEDRSRLHLTLRDGRLLEGLYNLIARQQNLRQAKDERKEQGKLRTTQHDA